MSESRLHLNLVKSIEVWVKNCDFIGIDANIYTDTPDTLVGELPPLIESYRPDLYARNLNSNRELLGEAKTPKDLESPRSKRQLEALIRKASGNDNIAIVLATRWDCVRNASSLIKAICNDLEIPCPNYAILDEFSSTRVTDSGWI